MASIVQRLASRSITGRDLGIDVHKHYDELLHLFWKQCDTEHCYTHILERRFLEAEEYTLVQKYIFETGFPRTCECMSIWMPGWNFPPCPFQTSGSSRHISHRRKHLSTRALSAFSFCKCPEVFLLGKKADVTVTIFCLNKHSKVSSRVPHTDLDWLRSRYLLVPASRMLNL